MKEIFILKENLKSVKKASDLFSKIKRISIDYTQENFILVCLNSKNVIISKEVLFKGGLNSCLICPKTMFRKALLKNANSVIIAHNHPSGNLTPSPEDINTYKHFKKAGEMLNLSVLDSIIFNKIAFYSLNQDGGF